jgi:hypothetical protein
VTLFNPAAVRTTRYHYKGTAIPSPWASEAGSTPATPGPVEIRMLGDGHVRFGRRLGETDRWKGRHRAPSRPHIALCHSRQEALDVKARLADWLAPRSLAFNEDKTRVLSLDDGFDFLGCASRVGGGYVIT